jgi:hypothetical protein
MCRGCAGHRANVDLRKMQVEQQPNDEAEIVTREQEGDTHGESRMDDAAHDEQQGKAKEARHEKVLTLLKEGKQKMGALIIRDQSQRDREGAIRFILTGMAKGFLIYTGPLCIIQRKITRPTVR